MAKIEAKSLVDAVTEQLEAAIIGGELAPGERLREQVLATEYGISRGPLREAIRRLEGRRLLERKANIGVRVVELSPGRLAELLSVREALEGMACRLAAERISPAELKQLRGMLTDHAQHQEVVSGEGYYQQSGDFVCSDTSKYSTVANGWCRYCDLYSAAGHGVSDFPIAK